MKGNIPYMKSLAMLRNGISNIGYDERFTAAGRNFKTSSGNKLYLPAEVKVLATLRFEGNDGSKDHAELYLLETDDGIKGFFEQ